MAWLDVHFYSKVIGLTSSMHVILPESDQGIGVGDSVWDGQTPLPVLFLLHGLSDDQTIWLRRTSLDRYAAGKRMAIVMPSAFRSYYSNQVFGYDFLEYIAIEVPRVCQRFFKISDKREENFIAGLSMGGYGAMKIGLNFPERFSRVASMSGILDFHKHPAFDLFKLIGNDSALKNLQENDAANYRRIKDFQYCFGNVENFANSENDLLSLLERKVKKGVVLPKMHVSIGSDDYLYPTNESFVQKLKQLRIPFEYLEVPGNMNGLFGINVFKMY